MINDWKKNQNMLAEKKAKNHDFNFFYLKKPQNSAPIFQLFDEN